METYKRRSVFLPLSSYCHLNNESSFIEVTDWHNGEGKDIIISRRTGEDRFSLTYGEMEALLVAWSYKGARVVKDQAAIKRRQSND